MLPKRIGINLLYLVPGAVGGTEIYARELIHELAAALPEHEFTAFVVREAEQPLREEGWPQNVQIRALPVKGANKPLRILAELFLLPIAAWRAGVKLLHSMGTTAPPLTRGARAVTIHDLIFHHHPDTFPKPAQKGLEILVPLGARRSHRVLADSLATKQDLIDTYAIDGGKIDVVHLGLGYSAPAQAASEAELRAEYELGERPVILCVASSLAHKNIPRLLDAYANQFAQAANAPMLVVVGHAGLGQAHLQEQAARLGVADRVRFTGWVEDAELEGLYKLAACFAYPTLREGFGMPVLEAMQRGTPVVCSNTTSLPEIVGDAAIMFDPLDVPAIGAAMASVLANDALAADLVRRGHEQVAAFTWAATARETIASYERAWAAYAGADASAGHNEPDAA